MKTVPLCLVTIIAESILRERLVQDVREAGAHGYTITDAEGVGVRERRISEIPGANIRLETIVSQEVPGQISGLFQHIAPAVRTAKGDLQTAIIGNVRNQALLLAEASPVISRMIQQNELIVAGGVYDLATGKVTPVSLDVN